MLPLISSFTLFVVKIKVYVSQTWVICLPVYEEFKKNVIQWVRFVKNYQHQKAEKLDLIEKNGLHIRNQRIKYTQKQIRWRMHQTIF
jgi:hypothetical protein